MAYKQRSPIIISEGGTAKTNFTAYAPILGGTTSTGALQSVASVGTAGQVLTSNGAGAAATFQAAGGGGSVTITGDSGSATGSNITLTGGTSGAVFTGSSTTVTESFNYLSLPVTTSTNGQVRINGDIVLWAPYNQSNTFVGGQAGNVSTLAALYNTGVGWQSGISLVGGTQNVFVGALSADSVTNGSNNVALGYNALATATTASQQIAIGTQSLAFMTNATVPNTAIGYQQLYNLTTGGYNVCIGTAAGGGAYNGAQSSNILINNYSTADVGDSNVLRIGDGTGSGALQLNKAFIHGIRGITTGNSDKQVVFADAVGQLGTNSGVYMSAIGVDCIFAGASAGNASEAGTGNTGFGSSALKLHTSGSHNTAVGFGALQASVGDSYNTCIGTGSGAGINGSYGNTAIGYASLFSNVASGLYNNALGYQALYLLNGGVNNTCLGTIAGSAYTSTESSNLLINHPGIIGESNICRLGAATGTGAQQLAKTFIAGIRGITTDAADAVAVLISSTGQLGTTSSSIRYKENIQDMADASSNLLKLRPVTFDFIGKSSHKKQVGLIAEEVYEVMPDLVVHNMDGLIESVKYHDLPALLLNELQKAVKRIEVLETKLAGRID